MGRGAIGLESIDADLAGRVQNYCPVPNRAAGRDTAFERGKTVFNGPAKCATPLLARWGPCG